MKNIRPNTSSPRGLTLIELLVVISIMVLLFAALVPRVKPALEEARLREGARQLNAYLASAQALATQRGVLVSVAFLRSANNTNISLQAQMVESPPIYAGDTEGSLCVVNGTGVRFAPPLPNDPSMVQVGDFIRFNYRTTLYSITGVDLANQAGSQVILNLNSGPELPANQPLAYQIIRLPVRNTSGVQGTSIPPLQLPRGVCVDLGQSGAKGMPGERLLPKDQFNPVVIFTPGGAVGLWYAAAANSRVYVPLPKSLFLLVGKVEQVGDYLANGSPDTTNLPRNDIDFSCRWVVVQARTGRVITVENATGTTITEHRRFGVVGAGMGAH